MAIWGAILNAGKSALNSSAGQSLLNAGVEAGASKLFDMDGFEEETSQSPTATLQPPTPPPEPENSVTDEKWFWPAVIGAVVVVIGLIAALARKN